MLQRVLMIIPSPLTINNELFDYYDGKAVEAVGIEFFEMISGVALINKSG